MLYRLLYFEDPGPNSLCAVLLPTSSLSLVAQLMPYLDNENLQPNKAFN